MGSFCVPEADTHRGNAAWSSKPGPCGYARLFRMNYNVPVP
jgi:hypothetical protein